jgi:hypothetical protein
LGDTGGRERRVQRADEIQQHKEEEEIRHDSDDSVHHSGKWSKPPSIKYNVARLATLFYNVSYYHSS